MQLFCENCSHFADWCFKSFKSDCLSGLCWTHSDSSHKTVYFLSLSCISVCPNILYKPYMGSGNHCGRQARNMPLIYIHNQLCIDFTDSTHLLMFVKVYKPHTHTPSHTHPHTHTHTCSHTCSHTHSHTHTDTHTRSHTHTPSHTHTHTHVKLCAMNFSILPSFVSMTILRLFPVSWRTNRKLL